MTQDETLDPRASLGRYVIEGEIGRGTMGVVYRALDPDLGRRVALKTIHAALAQTEEERDAFERRFLSEARAAAGLQHPGLVVVHDVGRDARTGVLFMALEYLEGRTLQALLSEGKGLPWDEAARLTARVAEALHHAHERGVIHRDVKPANVMLLPNGEPKVMDFGIARVERADLTSPGEALGTPLYMSPEQALGSRLDARSDVFSLGAVLYQLLTGRRAFDAPSLPAILAKVAQSDPTPPGRLAPLPADLDYVVARALAKTAAARYPTAQAMAEDLDDVRAGRAPRHRAGWVAPAPREADPAEHQPRPEPPTVALAPEPPTQPERGHGATGARRARLAVAAAIVIVLVVAGLLSRRAGDGEVRLPDLPLPAPLVAPARLEVAFEHTLRNGVVRVYLDDEQVLEQPLEARVTGRVLRVYKKRRGSVNEEIEVRPGEHTLRVEVESGDDRWARSLRGTFESGGARRLSARLTGGILGRGRDLELWWSPASEASPE